MITRRLVVQYIIQFKIFFIVNPIIVNIFARLNYLIAAMQIGEESLGSAEQYAS